MADLILLREWLASQYEFWMPIEGFPHYDVSSAGRVRSWLEKTWVRGTKGSRYVVGSTPRLLKITLDNRGYPRTYLYRAKRRINIKVHRLVAKAFVINPDDSAQVNHKTGVKIDNRPDNLEWVTKIQNMRHAFANGLFDAAMANRIHGQNHSATHLKDDDVCEIRRRAARGELYRILAEEFGISRSGISAIVWRRSWKHLV